MTDFNRLEPQPDEALRFLQLLGKDPMTARFRFFLHKDNPRKKAIGPRKEVGFHAERFARHQAAGRNAYVVIGEGGDDKKSISAIPALFVEWDDKPLEWQRSAWQEVDLPEPTLQVETGGKSLHNYWVLDEPAAPDQWKAAQARLSSYLGSDPSINDPSRVMRLPGYSYIGAEGVATGQCRIVSASGKRYRVEEVLANVPGLPAKEEKHREAAGAARVGARSMEEVCAALSCIPPFLPDNGQRDEFLRVAWGLLDAVREAGGSDAEAEHLLSEHSPEVEDVANYYRTEPHSIKAGTFWAIARTNGYRLERGADRNAPSAETTEDLERAQLAARVHVANAATTIDLASVLHPWLAERLIRRAEAFPLDPLALLAPGLATCAALIGTRARVEVKRSWTEPMLIWTGNVADASGLKSPASSVWRRPLVCLELEERAQRQRLKEAQDYENEKEKKLPPLRRFIAVDATYESVATMAAAPGNFGIISYQDELSSWFANLERQCSAGARAGWLSLWSGDPIIVDRKTTESVFASKSAVSLFGNVQPDKLAAMMAATGDGCETAGDGLWSRFLWVRSPFVPYVYVEKDEEIGGDIRRLLERLHHVPIGTMDDAPTLFRLCNDAIDQMHQFWEAWAQEERDSSPARKAFLGKLRGYSVRLAGLLAAIDAACDSLSQNTDLSSFFHITLGQWVLPVTTDHAERALILSMFFLAQFDALQDALGHGDLPANVAKLLTRSKENSNQPVPLRQVIKWKLPKRDALAAEALEWLQNVVVKKYGLGEMAPGPRRDSWVWQP